MYIFHSNVSREYVDALGAFAQAGISYFGQLVSAADMMITSSCAARNCRGHASLYNGALILFTSSASLYAIIFRRARIFNRFILSFQYYILLPRAYFMTVDDD